MVTSAPARTTYAMFVPMRIIGSSQQTGMGERVSEWTRDGERERESERVIHNNKFHFKNRAETVCLTRMPYTKYSNIQIFINTLYIGAQSASWQTVRHTSVHEAYDVLLSSLHRRTCNFFFDFMTAHARIMQRLVSRFDENFSFFCRFRCQLDIVYYSL